MEGGDPGGGPIKERRQLRRIQEEQERHRRRRAVFALGALGAVGVLVALLLTLGGDDSSKPAAQASRSGAAGPSADAGHSHHHHHRVPTVSDFHGDVPILMYHAIDEAPADAALPDLFVPPAEFEAELRYLKKAGFNGVTMQQVFDAWNKGKPIPRNPIVLSFDDGLRDQYTIARPALRKFRWPGVLNVKVDSITQGELDAAAIKGMLKAGWEVDSHTISHADVSTLSGPDLVHEIAGSRKILQNQFDVPVNFFCYPAGRYSDAAIAEVKRAGYLGATTVEEGLASPDEDPYTLKRIRVDAGDGPDGLRTKLRDAGSKDA